MAYLITTIQGMKNINELLLNQKSLERIVGTNFHDLDVKVTELTTTVNLLKQELDAVASPNSDDDDKGPTLHHIFSLLQSRRRGCLANEDGTEEGGTNKATKEKKGKEVKGDQA
ncbi:hypothetical protein D1007_31803 [Hordeum vulgare]|nr:hypothetical protein D1007_31803 [Hordeum vulgare]